MDYDWCTDRDNRCTDRDVALMEWCADCEREVEGILVFVRNAALGTLELMCPHCKGTNVDLLQEDDWREDR